MFIQSGPNHLLTHDDRASADLVSPCGVRLRIHGDRVSAKKAEYVSKEGKSCVDLMRREANQERLIQRSSLNGRRSLAEGARDY